MPTEVRSSWDTAGNDPRRGESPGSRSSPSNPRADGGHIANHLGKGAFGPVSLKRDNVPVAGEPQPVIPDRR
jgi:hypothetical protein